MGLDQWLVAKTKVKLEESEPTGVCSGMFGITCVKEDEQELGYLRKAYDQADFISYYCLPMQDGSGCKVAKEDIPEMISKIENILSTHDFDNEGYDISEDYDGFQSTWRSRDKWQTLLEALNKAKDLFEKDPDAEIIYKEWA